MQDLNLIQIVDAALLSATQRSGHHLACRPGCFQCCIGVFPISQQDAHRLSGCHSAAKRRNLLFPLAATITILKRMANRNYIFYVYILASRSRDICTFA